MAEKDERWPTNKPGKFYVDQSCIVCEYCFTTAPDNFIVDYDESHAYIAKQPETDEELELCQMAMDGCPVAAIGDDG